MVVAKLTQLSTKKLWRLTILRKVFEFRQFFCGGQKENSGNVKILFRSQSEGDKPRLIAYEDMTCLRRLNTQSLHFMCGILFINGKDKQGDSEKF